MNLWAQIKKMATTLTKAEEIQDKYVGQLKSLRGPFLALTPERDRILASGKSFEDVEAQLSNAAPRSYVLSYKANSAKPFVA